MKIIELDQNAVHRGSLLLVNACHGLKADDSEDLVYVDADFPEILLKREAVGALQQVFKRIAAGSSIVPVSGYRSAQEQIDIYDGSLKENGAEFTRKYVALPYHSEHQTGLAIDLGLNQGEIDFICPDFPYEGICQKFRISAPDFGFIQRYSKEKEEITGISHEPWHFRYVGCPHGRIIAENGFSLEEYTDYLKIYRENNPLVYQNQEIYYVPADGDKTQIHLPEDCPYQISGNNVDGFIVTVWRKKDD